jgi:hypothetical protein
MNVIKQFPDFSADIRAKLALVKIQLAEVVPGQL